MNMTGKSTAELLQMDVSKLSEAELRQVVSRIASAGNKRIKRLQESETQSPAVDSVMSSGGKFSVKNKNLNELREEFVREKEFFNKKTSSKRGIGKFTRQTVRELKKLGVDNIKAEDVRDAFGLYDKLRKRDERFDVRSLKYSTVEAIYQLSDKLDTEEKILAMMDRFDELYEQQEELYNELDGVSRFFEGE